MILSVSVRQFVVRNLFNFREVNTANHGLIQGLIAMASQAGDNVRPVAAVLLMLACEKLQLDKLKLPDAREYFPQLSPPAQAYLLRVAQEFARQLDLSSTHSDVLLEKFSDDEFLDAQVADDLFDLIVFWYHGLTSRSSSILAIVIDQICSFPQYSDDEHEIGAFLLLMAYGGESNLLRDQLGEVRWLEMEKLALRGKLEEKRLSLCKVRVCEKFLKQLNEVVPQD